VPAATGVERRSSQSGRQRAFSALLALCAGVTLTFLALPLVALFVETPLDEVPGLLGDPVVRDILEVTIRTNAIANVLILAFGTPTAYLLATRHFRGRALLITLVELPLVLPPAVAGIGLLAAFGAGGLLGDELQQAGIVLPFSEWAVILAVTFVASPFYVRQAIASFESIDPLLPAASRTLGAGPARTFLRVSLPLAAGGLVAGWVLTFARGIGEFGATIVFAGNVRGQTQTLTLGIYEQLEANFDLALAIGVLLVILSGTVLLTYKLVLSWRSSSSSSQSFYVPTRSNLG
jgi:molybdate transport system permease protein